MSARRLGTLLSAVLLALFCVGCTDDVRTLTEWTRVAPGVAPASITLPGELRPDATTADARTVLETVLHVPPEWSGKPVTLAILQFEGSATLSTDGRSLPDRSLGFAHAWRIEDAASASPILLRLELTPAVWPSLRTAPRLSPTADGDDWYRFVRTSTYHGSYVVTAILAFLFLLYLVLFLLDPRRAAHGWFGLQSAVGLPLTSRAVLDAPRVLGGVHDAQMELLCASVGLLAAASFTSAYFRTRAPPRVLLFLPLLAVPFFFFRSLSAIALYTDVGLAVLFVGIAWMTWTFVSIRAAPEDRPSARIMAIAWGLFILLASPDFMQSTPFADLAEGFHGGVVGMGAFASLQATLLLRDYIRSLRAADARAAQLAAQSHEVTLLNVELRRQIAARSRELADALARIGGVMPAPPPFRSGDVVHERYRVVRPIGEGAMGAVYEVARLADGRRFALKVLTSATTGAALARLAREAQVAARVTHERLVSIADVDVSEGGTLYIVMELVEGVTLVDLRDRYGDASWALPVLRQIAAGLVVLHDERIVHRDLKPANVLVGRPDDPADPGVKIADFGIARLPDDEPPGDDATLDSRVATGAGRALTGTGILLGTPLYMAPELARGARDAKSSSDIWAFGVMAFELLAGALPFEVPPVLDAMANRRWDAPRPLDPARGGPAVAAIVARCLHVEPESRPTAGECLEALQASSVGVASSPMASTRS